VNRHPLERPLFMYASFASLHLGDNPSLKYMNGLPADWPKVLQIQVGLAKQLDDAISNISSAMQARGMWEHTVFIVTTDHGQENMEDFAANAPLRGEKDSAWEGGLRVPTFVSGGFLPASVRGTKRTGITHSADWYGTFCALAGMDPTDHSAADFGLPPVDSLDLWPMISDTNVSLSRSELPLVVLPESPFSLLDAQFDALISGEYKYLRSTKPESNDACKAGCLFNIMEDPSETHDLLSGKPGVAAAMQDRLAELRRDVYAPQVACVSPDLRAYEAINEVWGGYLGPWLDLTRST